MLFAYFCYKTNYNNKMASFTLQAFNAQAVTPNDSTDIVLSGGIISGVDNGACLFVGTGGDLTITTLGGQTVTLTNLADGIFIPIQVRRVWATGTSALGILALY
jgi:hypothetical protein